LVRASGRRLGIEWVGATFLSAGIRSHGLPERQRGAEPRPTRPAAQRAASFARTALTMRSNSSRLTSEMTQWFMPPALQCAVC
jgi:hypothetical protein